MTDTTRKLGAASAIAVAALASGTALGRYTAASGLSATLAPVGMRWHGPTSNAQHPYYYGVIFNVHAGATQATREVICPTDGNPPSLDGYPYTQAAGLCAAASTFAQAVAVAQDSIAPSIGLSNAPDMAQPAPSR